VRAHSGLHPGCGMARIRVASIICRLGHAGNHSHDGMHSQGPQYYERGASGRGTSLDDPLPNPRLLKYWNSYPGQVFQELRDAEVQCGINEREIQFPKVSPYDTGVGPGEDLAANPPHDLIGTIWNPVLTAGQGRAAENAATNAAAAHMPVVEFPDHGTPPEVLGAGLAPWRQRAASTLASLQGLSTEGLGARLPKPVGNSSGAGPGTAPPKWRLPIEAEYAPGGGGKFRYKPSKRFNLLSDEAPYRTPDAAKGSRAPYGTSGIKGWDRQVKKAKKKEAAARAAAYHDDDFSSDDDDFITRTQQNALEAEPAEGPLADHRTLPQGGPAPNGSSRQRQEAAPSPPATTIPPPGPAPRQAYSTLASAAPDAGANGVRPVTPISSDHGMDGRYHCPESPKGALGAIVHKTSAVVWAPNQLLPNINHAIATSASTEQAASAIAAGTWPYLVVALAAICVFVVLLALCWPKRRPDAAAYPSGMPLGAVLIASSTGRGYP
jgi:hypothetical protein